MKKTTTRFTENLGYGPASDVRVVAEIDNLKERASLALRDAGKKHVDAAERAGVAPSTWSNALADGYQTMRKAEMIAKGLGFDSAATMIEAWGRWTEEPKR